MNNEPELITSELSQDIASGGKSVKVEIYRLESDKQWTLEIEDEFNNSTVWDETFETQLAALTEAKKSILAEGVKTFIRSEGGRGSWR